MQEVLNTPKLQADEAANGARHVGANGIAQRDLVQGPAVLSNGGWSR